MIDKLKEIFDIIILDGTPCLLVTDSMILARMVDSTIIVTAYKFTKKDNLEKIKKSIENVGGKIAGVVINKIPVNIKKYKSTYYYSSSNKGKRVEHGKRDGLNKHDNIKSSDIESKIKKYFNK